MSRNFVSDPREVTRPGDVVRVKVLGVDAARKRISLTLRLDDEPGREPGRRAEGGASKGSNSSKGGEDGKGGQDGKGRKGGQGGGKPGSDGAMAEALRRAGLIG